jgi:hypothetical protein
MFILDIPPNLKFAYIFSGFKARCFVDRIFEMPYANFLLITVREPAFGAGPEAPRGSRGHQYDEPGGTLSRRLLQSRSTGRAYRKLVAFFQFGFHNMPCTAGNL